MLIPAELFSAAPKDARWWTAVLPDPSGVVDDGYLYDEDDEENEA